MIALDTNMLVHAHQREADLHHAAKIKVRELAESPSPWGICIHSFVEYYAVVTHPRIWKQASTPEEAAEQINAWRESPSLRLLTDGESSLDKLQELALSANVKGGQIHDARIASCCITHGVKVLWTVDRDFSRFPSLKTKNPLVE